MRLWMMLCLLTPPPQEAKAPGWTPADTMKVLSLGEVLASDPSSPSSLPRSSPFHTGRLRARA